jgi:uncharacterized protein YcnI/copper(I)-binding protein
MFKTRFFSSLILSAAPAIAFAHASLLTPETPADSGYLAVLQVPHGCKGKPTTEVQIKLPEGFIAAKPMPKAGWDIEIIKGKYQKSYTLHGETINEGALEIRWKNGNLPDEYYDTFTISGAFSGIPAGTTVPFVSTQLCGADARVAWTEIPAEGQSAHDLKNPAPTVTLTAAEEHEHHHMDMGQADFAPVKIGDLALTAAFIKSMTPGQPVGGGFFTIANKGTVDDRLISVTPAAGVDHVEIHEMKMDGDVMRMRKLPDGIPVPAGQTVELKPGGLHMMFFGVAKPFAAGERVKATLTFEKAGSVEIEIPVRDVKGGMNHKM